LTRSSAPPPCILLYSKYEFIIKTEEEDEEEEEEEEEKLIRLEKRLVANVDFNDQALQMLGFHTDIHYLFENLGFVQFSNRVLANIHKEFTLEIIMTMAPILDKGVSSLSFWLEGDE
jgi:hypothetical protein